MTLEQQRAEFAWRCAQGADADYKNLAKGAPAFVMANGLMQALAFWKSKGQSHHRQLLKHLLGWLQNQRLLSQAEFEDTMSELQSANARDYRRATEEALGVLKWLRLYASAIQGQDGG